MSIDRNTIAAPRASLLKSAALMTFIGVRRAAREMARTPGYARSVACDVRDAWRESAGSAVPSHSQHASATPVPTDGRPPF